MPEAPGRAATSIVQPAPGESGDPGMHVVEVTRYSELSTLAPLTVSDSAADRSLTTSMLFEADVCPTVCTPKLTIVGSERANAASCPGAVP